MNLTLWDPFKEMEDLLERYAKSGRKSLVKKEEGGDLLYGDWMPVVDIEETDDAYLIKAELPGVKKEDVKVTIEEGVLTIQGEKKYEKKKKDKKQLRVERAYGSFIRSFTLPNNVKNDEIKAKYKDGVLTLTIPKTEEAKPKQLEIEIK